MEEQHLSGSRGIVKFKLKLPQGGAPRRRKYQLATHTSLELAKATPVCVNNVGSRAGTRIAFGLPRFKFKLDLCLGLFLPFGKSSSIHKKKGRLSVKGAVRKFAIKMSKH